MWSKSILNLPDKKYNTIVIDPPWDLPMAGTTLIREKRAKKLTYNTMSIEEIKNIDIQKLCNIGTHIYLWTTNHFLRESFKILEAWNVKFRLIIVMCKPSMICPNMGYQFATEFCLLGYYKKYSQKHLKAGIPNWFLHNNSAGNHSVKPDKFYKIVEKMSPEPRLDIFARQHRLNWDVIGDQINYLPVIEYLKVNL